MIIKEKIYPVFIHFEPNNNRGKNINLNFNYPNTVDMPIFYDVTHDGNVMELSIHKKNIKINNIIDIIRKKINNNYYTEIIDFEPFDDERTNFFFTSIDEFLSYYRIKREDFWYLKYIFICPFSLLFCHNNECYADEMGRGFPEGEIILYIPRHDYPVDLIKCDYINKLNTIQNRFVRNAYQKSFQFFDDENIAADLWIEALDAQITKKRNKMLLMKFHENGRSHEANPF